MSSIKTMKAWAIKIDQTEKIPAVFQKPMEQVLEEEADFPYMIYAPRNEKTGKPVNDTLLAMTEGTVWVLVDDPHQAAVVRFSMQEIQTIQMGTVLLESWIMFCGKTAGDTECAVVYYDTVMEELFVPVLETVRTKMLQIPAEAPEAQADELHYLKDVSLKFYNYGIQSLMPGQKVCCSVYQPRVEEKVYKQSEAHETAPHLFILTEEELILIQETEQEEKSATQRYSGIWTHFPISQIEHFNVEDEEDGHWMKISINAKGQEPVQVIFDPRNRQAVQVLANQLKISQGR